MIGKKLKDFKLLWLKIILRTCVAASFTNIFKFIKTLTHLLDISKYKEHSLYYRNFLYIVL